LRLNLGRDTNFQLPTPNSQTRERSRSIIGSWRLGIGSYQSRHVLALALSCLALVSCRQDMHDAPRYEPLEEAPFFADGRSSRVLVANTVARGQLREDEHLYTGKIGGQLATEFPMPVTNEVMARGQERFNVFCSPCHGRTGEGNGMIVQRGFRQPPSYHEDRLVNAPVGYFFDVMTNGFGAMQDYAAQVPVADRWAIAAYLKALQLSRRATMEDVPAERRAELDRAPDVPPPASQGPAGSQPPQPGGSQPAAPGATLPPAAPAPNGSVPRAQENR
jgi:cytochrome c553